MDRIKNHPILGETPKRKKVTFSYDGKLLEGYEGEPIATGASENMVNFEGWTKPAVIGAGAAPRVGG